jgi:integrase
LAFSTGARINELCQLRKSDVCVEDGIPVLIIHGGADGQRVKNPGSARRMPLHPSVHDFLDYAAQSAGPWVFPFKCYANDARRAGWLSQKFPQFRKTKCGINDNVTLHRARDFFIDAMRDAGVPEDRRKAIVGHVEGNGQHARYGRGVGLKVLAAEVAKVELLA